MNAGQYLLALSPLPSGTAAQHLLAIQLGAGTGQTIFCSQRTAIFEQEETFITRQPKREVINEPAFVQPQPTSDERKQNFYAIFRESSSYVVRDGAEEVTATRRTVSRVVTLREDRAEVIRSRK